MKPNRFTDPVAFLDKHISKKLDIIIQDWIARYPDKDPKQFYLHIWRVEKHEMCIQFYYGQNSTRFETVTSFYLPIGYTIPRESQIWDPTYENPTITMKFFGKLFKFQLLPERFHLLTKTQIPDIFNNQG